MFRRLRCQVVPKLGSTAGPRALGTKPGRSNPKWVPQSSLEAPRRVLGDPDALDVAASSLPSPAKIGKHGWTKSSRNEAREVPK